MSEWHIVKLSDVVSINPVESLPKNKMFKKISMEHLAPYTKRPTGFATECYRGGMKFKNGDTIVARITPCLENGKTAFIDLLDDGEVAFGSTEYIVLRAIDTFSDSHFIYYFSRSPIFRDVAILSMTGSSGRQRVQTDVVTKHLFEMPPIYEQQAIAQLLCSLDNKIDLLHRQNKTLEALAETLFRQWFVEGTDEKVEITHYVKFNPTRSLRKGSLSPYLDMAGVSTTTFSPSGWYDREFTSGTKFINGDTLLARITPCLENGKSAFVTFLEPEQVGWGSTEFIVMRSRDGLSAFFTYVLARNQEFRDYAEGCMAGSSGRQRVDVEHLKQFEIGRVIGEKVAEFNCQLQSIPPKLHLNMLQIRTLEKLRDTLLPKLMSGEARVQYE